MATPSTDPPQPPDDDAPYRARAVEGWGEAARRIPEDELRVSTEPFSPEETLQLSVLDPRPGMRILDIGGGDGAWPALLAVRGAEVWAIDVSPDACETARRRAEVNGVSERVHVRVVTGPDLPFNDGTFDALHGVDVLHRMDKERFGRELARVLRPAGRAVFSELVDKDPPPPGKDAEGGPMRTVTRDQLHALAEAFDGLVLHDLSMGPTASGLRAPSWIDRLRQFLDRRPRPPTRHVLELVASGADAG